MLGIDLFLNKKKQIIYSYLAPKLSSKDDINGTNLTWLMVT